MPPLIRGPEKDLAVQFEKLRKELPKAIAKSGTVSLPDVILNSVKGAVRRYRKGSQLIPSKYIETLIPLLDADGYNTCKRLSVKVFITVVEAILQTEPCRQGERGLYLLGAGLYHAARQQSRGNSIVADKVEIGKDCMHVLLVHFTNPENSLEARQWVGAIMLQLLKNCSTNVEKLTTGSADYVCLLGKFVIEEVNEILKLVFAEVVNAILNTSGPKVDRKELWPQDINPTAYNDFPVGDSQLGQGWNRRFDGYLSNMEDLGIIETTALNTTLFWSPAVATAPEHDIGIPGRNVSVLVGAKEITILAPFSSTEFYTCLEIPLNIVEGYHADYETTYRPSQNPGDFTDLVIEFKRRGKECFCYKNSTAVELEGVRLTFPLAAIEDVLTDIDYAISRLDVDLEGSSLQRLEMEEHDSSAHASKNNEMFRAHQDNAGSGIEQESYSGAVASRKSATALITTVKVAQVEGAVAGSSRHSRASVLVDASVETELEGTDMASRISMSSQAFLDESEAEEDKIDIVQTQPTEAMNHSTRQLNASTAIIDDESGSEDSFNANLLKPQYKSEVDHSEDEDELAKATPPLLKPKRSSGELAEDAEPSSGAMSSLDKLKRSFRVPSRVGPMLKPSLDNNNSSLPAAQRDLRSQKPTKAGINSSSSKPTEAGSEQVAAEDDSNISEDNSGELEKGAASKTEAKQLVPRSSKTADVSVNGGEDNSDVVEKKVASKAKGKKQAPRSSKAASLSVDEIEDGSDVLEKEAAPKLKEKKQAPKNSKTAPLRSNKTNTLKSKPPLVIGKSGTQYQPVKTAEAAQTKDKELAKKEDIFDLPEDDASSDPKKVGQKPPSKAPNQTSQTRVAKGKINKSPKLQKQEKNKDKSEPPKQPNRRSLKSQRAAAKIANEKLQEVNEEDPLEEQSVVPAKRGTNPDTGSNGESKAEAHVVSSKLKQRSSTKKDTISVPQTRNSCDVEKDNIRSSQKQDKHNPGPSIDDEHQLIQNFENGHDNDLYNATPRVSRQKKQEKDGIGAEVQAFSPAKVRMKMAKSLANMLDNFGETESNRNNIQPGPLRNKSAELRMTQTQPQHVAPELSPKAHSPKILSKSTDLAVPSKSQFPRQIATAQIKVITDQESRHQGQLRLHKGSMKDDIAMPNNMSLQISTASDEENEILGLGKTAAETQNSNPQAIAGMNGKPIVVQEDALAETGSDILPEIFDTNKAPEVASGIVPRKTFKTTNKPRQSTSREQTASANNKAMELDPKVNNISRSKTGIVASQGIAEKHDYVGPIPESTERSVQKQHSSLDKDAQTPRSDKKRKAKDVDIVTLKRVRLATDADGQVSPLRLSPRLHVKPQVQQIEAPQKSKKNTRRPQPLTSPSTRYSPRLEAITIQAAAALNKALSMNMPLVDDTLVRKPALINFGGNGPRNQGASSVSRSSGNAKESYGTQEVDPAINDGRGSKGTGDTKIRVASQAEESGPPVESTIHGAGPHPTNLITNRKRAKAGYQEESLSPPRKRHSPSPTEFIALVNNDLEVTPQPVSPLATQGVLEVIPPPRIYKQDVPTAPQRQSFRLGSQSSRVDLNGSPMATARVDHISKIEKKLQPNAEPHTDGRQADTFVAQNLYPIRPLSEGASIMFGPRVPLSSLAKTKPAAPGKEEVRYVPHKKNMRTGAYEEIGTTEAIAPQKVLQDPFLEKETRCLSKFTQRLQAVEPNRAMSDKKRLLLASTVARVFDGEQDSSPAQKSIANTNILKGVDLVFDEAEDETTLVGDEKNIKSYKVSSPAGLTSGSSDNSPDEGAPKSTLSETSVNKVWNGALRPHYRAFYDGVQHIIDELFIKLHIKEYAIEARIDEYRVNGTKLLVAFDEQRQVDRGAILQDFDSKKKHLVEVFQGSIEYLSRPVEEIERSPLDAYEKEWQERQEDVERSIANARGSLVV